MPAFELHHYGTLVPVRTTALTQSFATTREGRPVFVKQLRPDLAADEATRRAWLSCAEQATQVRHPRLVEVLTCGEHEGAAYLAEAWVEGCSLREALDTRPIEQRALPPGDVVTIAKMVLEGLGALAAAQPPMQHLSLSPDTVWITTTGELVLDEPGLWAAIPPREAARLQFDRGSVSYQSPEQIQARGELDARSDLFSLGCMLFELLSGQRAHEGKSQLLVAMAISRGERQSLAALRPDLPENVVAIVETLCAHDPNERFGSAAAALNALSVCDSTPQALPELTEIAKHQAKQAPAAAPSPAAPTASAAAAPDALKGLEGLKRDGRTAPFLWAPGQGPDASEAPAAQGGESVRPAAPPMVAPPPAAEPEPGPQLPTAAAPPRVPGAPVPPPVAPPSLAGSNFPPATRAEAGPQGPRPASPVPPPMVKPPPMVGTPHVPALPAAPAMAGGPTPPPRAPVAPPGVVAPPASAMPAGAPTPSPAAPGPVAPPAMAGPVAGPGSPGTSGAGPGGRIPPGPTPPSSQPSHPPPAPVTPAAPLAPLSPPAPTSGSAEAAISGGPPSASGGSAPARWQEPSKTVFQMKARPDLKGPRARGGTPLGVKLLLAGMATFGVVLLAALAVRMMR